MTKKSTQHLMAILSILLCIGVHYTGKSILVNQFEPSQISLKNVSLKEKEEKHIENEQATNVYEKSGIMKDKMNIAQTIEESLSFESTRHSETTIPSDQPRVTESEESTESEEPIEPEEPTEPEVPKIGFDIDENHMLVHFYDGSDDVDQGYLELPNTGCIGILAGAFTTYSGYLSEFFIPANVSVIQPGAFIGLNQLEYLDVDEGNPSVSSIDGVVFCENESHLLAFPSARSGIYSMPYSVTYLCDSAFYNTSLEQINLLGMGYVTFGNHVFGPNNGAGVKLRVPSEYELDYRNALSGYDVQIIGV